MIVTDNPIISSKIFKICTQYEKVNFEFGISPFSKANNFEMEVFVVDMKKKRDIEILLNNYDLIISVHCKQIFPVDLFNNVKCINIHPGYNPINRGWYPQVFAILNDEKIGATIHEITKNLDDGPIIDREYVDKFEWDTSLTLYKRVVNKELELFEKNISSIINNCYSTELPESNGNLYLKKDFERLKEIDLTERVTFKEAIDRLRALTHGEYKNLYYTTQKDDKVFISVNLTNDDGK
ncbi:MAG: dTDP-4-amino-4,6-dideoxyglucose formyltransferase [Candidatus Paceibacterota bacterium]